MPTWPPYWLPVSSTPKWCGKGFHGWLTISWSRREPHISPQGGSPREPVTQVWSLDQLQNRWLFFTIWNDSSLFQKPFVSGLVSLRWDWRSHAGMAPGVNNFDSIRCLREVLQVGYYTTIEVTGKLNSDWTWCEGFASTRCFGVERLFLQAAWIMYSSSLRITLSKYSKSIGFEVRGCTFPPKPSPLDGDIRRLKPTPLKITKCQSTLKYIYNLQIHIFVQWNTIGLSSLWHKMQWRISNR